MTKNFKIDYLEFPATDIKKARTFYERVFGWEFTDYGPNYTSFKDGRLEGGFTTQRELSEGGPLAVIYAEDLESTQRAVKKAGGVISKPTFPFPGGKRFHFQDPSGVEMAVWSES